MVEQFCTVLVQNGNQQEFSEFEDDHRSVYLPIVRSAEPEMLHAFDLPDPELVVGDRSVTNVPAQSLFFMNSKFMLEQSKALAERVLGAAPNDRDRLDTLYWLAYGRAASAEEQARILQYLSKSQDNEQSWAEICQTVLASAEFRYVE
jgi:hypothetical protein